MQMRIPFLSPGGVALMGVLGLMAQPLPAATVDMPTSQQAPSERGAPLYQRVLDSGASIISTADRRYCAVSHRIDIAASDYRGADGAVIPFDQVIRSSAASTQVMAGPDGLMGIRVQMKYSPAPDAEITLTIGTASEEVAMLLEPSTDSLRIGGDLATRLATAFRDGIAVQLETTSRATGRQVTDVLAAPDMAALTACQTELAALPEAPLPPLSNQLSLDFDASPSVATLATPEDYRASGMKAPDLPLYLGRIRATTGFYTHTDKIFVSFDDKGRVDRVYVPGLMDGRFAGEASGEVQVSQSADSNLPDAENRVTGRGGYVAQHMCHIPQIGGVGHRLQVCDIIPASDPFDEQIAAFDPPLSGGLPLGGGGFGLRSGSTGSGGSAFIPSGGGGGTTGSGGGESPEAAGGGKGPPPPPPSPVPVPAAGLLLLAALGSLLALRRRKSV